MGISVYSLINSVSPLHAPYFEVCPMLPTLPTQMKSLLGAMKLIILDF